MKLSKVLIPVVLSLLFVSLISGICQAGELDEREKSKRVRLTEGEDNPFLSEKWRPQEFAERDLGSFLPDIDITYVSSILWTGLNDVRVAGDYAYCAFQNGLVILDVSDLGNPTFVSRLYLEGQGLGIFVLDNYAYLADGDVGLLIIDISDPFSPYVLGSYRTPDGTPGLAWDVLVQDSIAYLAYEARGLHVVSVSDPSNPYLMGSCDTPGYAEDLFVQDSLAYVTQYGAWSGLQIISVSDPSNPYPLGSYDAQLEAVFVQDSLAYVAAMDGGLQIISVANPSNPYFLGSHETPGYASAVWVQDSLAYVGDRDAGLLIISVSDPSDPYLLGSYDTPGHREGFFVEDSLAYVPWWEGLHIISVSDPSTPYLLGDYYEARGAVLDVSVQDSLAYVADYDAGLQIVCVSAPSNPYLLGNYDTPGLAYRVFVRDSLAYVGDRDAGLLIISVSDPSDPYLLGSYDTPGQAFGVFVRDSLAYVAAWDAGLQIVSVSDPSNAYLLGSHDTPGQAFGVFVRDNLAYVADYDSGLQIISISDPTNPYLLGSCDTPGRARGVFAQDSLAYVATRDDGGLQIISVSDPSSPYLLGSYGWSNGAWDVFIRDSLAYVVVGWGLSIISVSDPSNPYLMGDCGTPGHSYGVFVQGSLVYVADATSLMILETTPVDPPDISVSPDSLSEDLFTGQTSTQTLTLQNTGGSDLTFHIVIDTAAGEKNQNYALQFDGFDDDVDFWGFSLSTNAITVEAWVNHETLPSSIQRYVTVGPEIAVIRHDGQTSSGQLHFYIKTDGTLKHIRVNHALTTEQWYHIAGTWDGTTQRLYKDGVEIASQTPGGSLYPASELFLSSSVECMDGVIDEVRIWNVARTQAEIQMDMHREIFGAEPGLAGYWRLNEGSGNTAFDQTSNGNDGTLGNGVAWIVSTAPISPAWLSMTPVSGTVPAGSFMDTEVTFDATGLYAGEYDANIVISSNDPDEPEVTVPAHLDVTDAPTRGDVNVDGVIDVGDVVYLINFVLKDGPSPDPLWTGDCNCDEVIDLDDVIFLIHYLYMNGPPPVC